MLQYLKIDNLALIESSEMEFSPGFNVITGESGAGKSITLGGIALLLGERADSGAIRSGEKRAEVSAMLSVPERQQESLRRILEENDIEESPDGTVLLRRVITPSASRNYINSTPVNLKTLHDAAGLLIDMQKCDDHLSLGNCVRQLELLDRYAGLAAERAACAESAAAEAELARAKKDFAETLLSDAELELAEELVEAVEKVNPAPGEDETLASRHDRAAAAHEILTLAQALVNQLSEGEESLSDKLADINRELANLARLDENGTADLTAAGDRLSEEVRELAGSVASYAGGIELDEEEFSALEERLSSIYTLKRRFGPTLAQVLEKFEAAKTAIDDRRAASQRLTEFDSGIAEAHRALLANCAVLSEKRRAAARRLAQDLTEPLHSVGFDKCRFELAFSAAAPGENGADAVEMLFSANAGEEMRPLRLIASSGERSRLFLALKTVLADADDVPTAVFDEIDVNIGGETANKVGLMLRELGKKRQLILISHLPQVACGADRHFGVVKLERGGRTVSETHPLSGAEITRELGRMFGGGDAALSHAEAIQQTLFQED